jgi:hypothetical protein
MNNKIEIIDFLLPQFELLQMTFFVLMLLMAISTIIFNHRNANTVSWEKIWHKNTPNKNSDDALDIDHGSVTDLWRAVETKSEKLAEIMPSMLLVMGLLGTFLGLGMALNHASSILGQHDAISASGQVDSMKHLMEMMQGLGVKFKTSTWGIAFFLLLKVWSSLTGFDEKRLSWVIRKVKVELENRKSLGQQTESNKQQALFAQINQSATQIVQGLSHHVGQLIENQNTLHKESIVQLEKGMEIALTNSKNTLNSMQSNSENMQKVMKSSMTGIREELININTVVLNSSQEMLTAMQNNSTVVKKSIDLVEKGIRDIRQDLARIDTATQTSSQAMVGFVNSTQTIIKDMSNASEKMADGADKVGKAGADLVGAVNAFSTEFTQVLGDMQTSLSGAINEMSQQAAFTLSEGTEKLGNATRDISKSLDALSKDVTVTMTEVKESIGNSLKIQQDGAVLFRRSSDTLNENVTATTGLVEKLGEDIRSGLSAVSDSGRRMAGIGKSLEAIVPELKDLPAALATENKSLLSQQNDISLKQQQNFISALQGGMGQFFKRKPHQGKSNS